MSDEKNGGKINIGVSACLLGQKVRFDSGHKHDRYITDVLGEYFKFIAVCPEVEAGMGVPRESVRLIAGPDGPRMVGSKTGQDWTEKMKALTERRTRQLETFKLRGYILKKDSPSCGMERVKLYPVAGGGAPSRDTGGLYGDALLRRYPLLPVEEEGRLNDAPLRDNFIVRVFAYDRLQNLFEGRFSRGEAVNFHARHKYLLMAHSPEHYRKLGQLVAAIKKHTPSDFREKYSTIFLQALAAKATIRKNVNVLQHIMGYLREFLDGGEKKYILGIIEDYHRELVPLVVPITLIKQFIWKYDVEYIKDQYYLDPHPKELMLRNHV